MEYIQILKQDSHQVIELRLSGQSWKEIKSNNKYTSRLRKSDTYIDCVVEKINDTGLESFESICLEKGKSITNYLCRLFGINRSDIGTVS